MDSSAWRYNRVCISFFLLVLLSNPNFFPSPFFLFFSFPASFFKKNPLTKNDEQVGHGFAQVDWRDGGARFFDYDAGRRGIDSAPPGG